MLSFKDESSIPQLIGDQDSAIPRSFPNMARHAVTEDFYNQYVGALQQSIMALDNLLPSLAGRPRDSGFIDQLRDYVRRLLNVEPAGSAEEQFNHLYALRKWLFFVPSMSLRSTDKDYTTLIVISYFYAVALEMDCLFPDVAPIFCCSLVERPLYEVFGAFEKLEVSPQHNSQQLEHHMSLLAYPKQASAAHQARKQEARARQYSIQLSPPSFRNYIYDLEHTIESPSVAGHHSPAFGPPQQKLRELSQASSSTSSSRYFRGSSVSGDATATASGTALYQPQPVLPSLPLIAEPQEEGSGFDEDTSSKFGDV